MSARSYFRDYERALDQLKAIFDQLATDEGRDAALTKIKIGLERDLDSSLPGMRAVATAVADAMRADVPKYLAGLIDKAQDDVHAAAAALRNAIDADLASALMKRGKGK
jgi:hypothetical protein